LSLHTIIQKYLKETKAHHDVNNKIAEEIYYIQNKSSKASNTWAHDPKRELE